MLQQLFKEAPGKGERVNVRSAAEKKRKAQSFDSVLCWVPQQSGADSISLSMSDMQRGRQVDCGRQCEDGTVGETKMY